MKRILLLPVIGAFIFLAACSGNKSRFTVIVDVKNAPDEQPVFLQELTVQNQIVTVDSGQLNDKGHIELSGEAPQPGLYRLYFGDKDIILLSVESGTLKLAADWKKLDAYTIQNSSPSQSLKRFRDGVSEHMGIISTLQNAVIPRLQAQGRATGVDSANADIQAHKELLTKFVTQYADSTRYAPNALFAVRFLDPSVMSGYLQTFAEGVSKRFPNSKAAAAYVQQYRQYLAQQESANSGSPTIGGAAPEISLPAPDGAIIKLSSLRGKVVLVDFWASWCGPCRAENPNVVAAYNRFREKGFTVYGVSLDNEKEKWNGAIKDDGLVWTQVSELKGWESGVVRQWGFEAIPTNFLLDAQGKIVARDLRGGALEAKLADLFK